MRRPSLDIALAHFQLRRQVVMKICAMLRRLSILGIVILGLAATRSESRAQASADNPPARPNTPEDLSPSEVLKSYLQVRDQLHAAQLAIANNRLEAEAKARAQTAALTEKLEAIRLTVEAERERQRAEIERTNAERERQRIEMQNANRTVLWIAGVIGVSALLVMVVMPFVQWRAINRVAEISAQRIQLAPLRQQSLLPAEASAPLEQAVTLSNQRLLTVIDRLERRILDLEHTAGPAAPAAPAANPNNGALDPESARRRSAAADQAAWIAVLLAKGQSLLAANKAKEALVCFDEILKLNENHAETLVKKGVALERLRQDEAALLCFNRAIELDRNMTLAYLHKGGVCNRLQRYDEAVECYEEALKVEEAGNKSVARA